MCSPGTWWRTVCSRFPVGLPWVLFEYSCRITYRTWSLWIIETVFELEQQSWHLPPWNQENQLNQSQNTAFQKFLCQTRFLSMSLRCFYGVCVRAHMWGPGCRCGAVTHGSLQLGDILMGLDPRRAHTLVIMCWWTVLWLFPLLVFLPIWLWISLIVCIFYGVNGVYCRRWMHMDVFA